MDIKKNWLLILIVFSMGFEFNTVLSIPKNNRCDEIFYQVKKHLIIVEANNVINDKNSTKEQIIKSINNMKMVTSKDQIDILNKLLEKVNEH